MTATASRAWSAAPEVGAPRRLDPGESCQAAPETPVLEGKP